MGFLKKNKPKISEFTSKITAGHGFAENIYDIFHIEMNSNKEVVIEGNRGILDYNENNVKVSVGKMVVSFSGRNLSLNCLTEDSLVINGFITNVEFVA